MYNKVYQCKLCKKIIIEKVYDDTIQSMNIKLLNSDIFNKKKIHFCNDSEMGILEVIGVKKGFN
ncbi:MAG: hypothetical protein K2O59_03435 [Lachnospiraceae bacterium]|nr:hypothetical protein [Lachnospiraceae bacterium]